MKMKRGLTWRSLQSSNIFLTIHHEFHPCPFAYNEHQITIMTVSSHNAKTQPTRKVSWAAPPPPSRRRIGCCFSILLVPILFIGLLAAFLYISGGRSNLLVLGLDSRQAGSDLGRSDTIILTTFIPREPYIGMLSIPRDLWITLPDGSQNRINTAHFFAESEQPGSGPQAALKTVRDNFGVDVQYYIRVRFDGFLDLMDLLQGVDIELPTDMSGYTAGRHHLDSVEALAFVRDRAGSDDFFRMQRAQIFIMGLWQRFMDPAIWPNLPDMLPLVIEMVDTNLPWHRWIYLAGTMLRLGADGIDARVISRQMTFPFTTDQGAQVLAPNWQSINPLLQEMFVP
jgi:LCP family protein required for cell wall assembly